MAKKKNTLRLHVAASAHLLPAYIPGAEHDALLRKDDNQAQVWARIPPRSIEGRAREDGLRAMEGLRNDCRRLRRRGHKQRFYPRATPALYSQQPLYGDHKRHRPGCAGPGPC